MEKIIYRRLLDVLMGHDFLSDKQYGFGPGFSTGQAIFKLHNDVARSINRGDITGLVYVDVAKAFDSIHHGRLLNELSMLDLSSGLVSWF